MINIYYGDCTIVFTNSDKGYNGKDITTLSEVSLATNLAQKVQTCKQIVILCDNPQKYFDSFSDNFTVIHAAGGVVNNLKGGLLMIYRSGKWDLPKGKLESGEEIGECALREVSEECGVSVLDLEITHPLNSTYHIYTLAEKTILKQTHWFKMRYSGSQQLKGQAEEGITSVEWVDKQQQKEYLKNSYKTIVSLLEEV